MPFSVIMALPDKQRHLNFLFPFNFQMFTHYSLFIELFTKANTCSILSTSSTVLQSSARSQQELLSELWTNCLSKQIHLNAGITLPCNETPLNTHRPSSFEITTKIQTHTHTPTIRAFSSKILRSPFLSHHAVWLLCATFILWFGLLLLGYYFYVYLYKAVFSSHWPPNLWDPPFSHCSPFTTRAAL